MGYLGIIIVSYTLLNFQEENMLSRRFEFQALSIFLFAADYISELDQDYALAKCLSVAFFFGMAVYFSEMQRRQQSSVYSVPLYAAILFFVGNELIGHELVSETISLWFLLINRLRTEYCNQQSESNLTES